MNSPIDGPIASAAPPLPAPPAAAASGYAWHGVDHYENFPVGSWLLPRRLRPAVVAIYRFARYADDVADEGDAPPAVRDARLQSLHRALVQAQAGHASGEPVVDGLSESVGRHRLDWRHFHDLLDAFQQDLRVRRYADPQAVDDYCRRSANPVGRLMLELFEVATNDNLAYSDAICSALQRINFLQDITVDFKMDRVYLPQSTLAACGVDEAALAGEISHRAFRPATRRAVAIETQRARRQLLSGRPLLARVPLRLGLELRFILAGALHILDRLQAAEHDVAAGRPRLRWHDAPALLHKAATLSRRRAELS